MAYVDAPEVAQISAFHACAAAGVDRDTLNNWVSRRPAILEVSRSEVDRGRPVLLFTLRQTYKLALIQAMVRLGIPPKLGAHYAMAFTDSSDGKRLPGALYSARSAETWLFITDRDRAVVRAVDISEPFDCVRRSLLGSGPFTAISVTDIVHKVRDGLGLPLTPEGDWPTPHVPQSSEEFRQRVNAARLEVEPTESLS